MSPAEALKAALDTGISLHVDGDRLVLEAPSPPPDTVLDLLSRHKMGVMALLRGHEDDWPAEEWQAIYDERAAIAEFDGGLSRADAEQLAAESQGYSNVVAFRAAKQNNLKGKTND